MKTREEILKLIEDGGGKYIVKGIEFIKENNIDIKASVDGIVFYLWDHFDKISDFYFSSGAKLCQLKDVNIASEKLADYLGIDLGLNTIKITNEKEVIKEVVKSDPRQEGKIEAYENLLLKRKVTLE